MQLWQSVVVAAVALACSANILHNAYAYDDDGTVTHNSLVLDGV